MKYIKLEDYSKDYNADTQIKLVTLNRPEVRNAFNPEMILEISTYFESISKHNADIKLIILKGEGAAFCAGADLNWMKAMVNFSKAENIADSQKLWTMFDSIRSCPVPVVGLIHGSVFGGALGLVACCDYVFAEESTQFCFSEVKLGLAPAIISDFISQKIPDGFFRPYMISAEVFKAQQAQSIGLVHKLYAGQIDLSDVVKNFQSNGTDAMKETKRLLNQLQTLDNPDERKMTCAQVISERRMSDEGQERLKKFLAK